MKKIAVSPDQAFYATGESADRILQQINQDLQNGRRAIIVAGEFPEDFKKRVIALFEEQGWVVTEDNNTLNFIEKSSAGKTEKQALMATQVITNLIILMNEQIQSGKREIGHDIVKQNLDKLSVGLEKKFETVDEITDLLVKQPRNGKQFERLLELAGWKLDTSGDTVKLSAL